MTYVTSLITKIRKRPTALAGVAMGLAIFGVFFRGEDTRRETNYLTQRVIRVESASPCTNLTASECALKLFRNLPEESRRQLRVTESTIRALEARAARERQALRQERSGSSSPQPSAGGGSPGGNSEGTSPPTEQKPPGSSPGNGQGGSQPPPSPPPTNPPLVRVPSIKTPPIGPVPPIETPPIEINPPCIGLGGIFCCP